MTQEEFRSTAVTEVEVSTRKVLFFRLSESGDLDDDVLVFTVAEPRGDVFAKKDEWEKLTFC